LADTAQSAPTPEQVASQAAAHANSAQASATAADLAKQSAEAAYTKAAKIRKDFDEGRAFRGIAAAVSIATVLLVGWQGWLIRGQLIATEKQLKATEKQLDATEKQLRLSRSVEYLANEQRLKQDTQAITTLVYDENGAFAAAKTVKCEPMPSDADSLKTKTDFRSIISHYELYYRAAILGGIRKDRWASLCAGAKQLFADNCLLKRLWEVEKDVTPEFRKAFIPICKLEGAEAE
jgi:hypothetical protein